MKAKAWPKAFYIFVEEKVKVQSNYAALLYSRDRFRGNEPLNTDVTPAEWESLEKMKQRTAASAAAVQQKDSVLRAPLQAKVPLVVVPQNYIWQKAPQEVREAICQFSRQAGLHLGALSMGGVSIALKRVIKWCKVEAGGKVWELRSFSSNGPEYCSATLVSKDGEIVVSFKLVELVRAFRSVS